VRLRIDAGVLQILIPLHATDYVPISQRSDGLRQFIALRAFVAAQDALDPVLLIDEAERHLHYDAQADLVEVLTEQIDAPKVIYSTHSAGCLPHDLGTGVRAIVPSQDSDESVIENSFWSEGLAFSPLLIGMGASALAFASARKAVIGEGISESILLPSLLREATGQTSLDYQVAPGLANASRDALGDLDLTAARVVYLVDGDSGGAKLKKRLCESDVPEKLILVLGADKHPDLTLEDLVDANAFLVAVNAELRQWTEASMRPNDLRSPVRWNSVKAWCKAQSPSISVPSKRAIAQHLVNDRRDRPLVAREHRATVKALHKVISKALDQPAHRP
jgi:predicted ATP-dependent endonuclease of OLD family